MDKKIKFPDTKILYTLCRELNWSKIRLIMRLNSEKERNFYINESKQIFASRYKTVLPTEEELKEELEKNRHFLENKSN